VSLAFWSGPHPSFGVCERDEPEIPGIDADVEELPLGRECSVHVPVELEAVLLVTRIDLTPCSE